jgi:hypothetical protein
MSHRSSELQDHIEGLGGNLNGFYQQRETQIPLRSNIYDLDRFAIPESPISETENLPVDDPSAAEASHCLTYLKYLYQRPDSQSLPAIQLDLVLTNNQEEYESESENESNGLLLETPGLEMAVRAVADSDLVVQKYSERPDPPLHSFPSSFLQTIPFAVLKALYYLNNFHPDWSHLVHQYDIPPSVQTVMMYSRYDNNFDGFKSSCWPSLKLHPAVRKALFLG